MTTESETRKRPKPWIIAGTVIAAVVLPILGYIFFVVVPSINDRGVSDQEGLSRQYSTAAATLSECLNNTSQAAQVAGANAEAFKNVIKATVAETNAATAHVDLNSAQGRGTLLPILAQAWPDVTSQTALFDKVVTIIVDCQGKFRGQQTVIQDRARSFNTWRQSYWASMFGADKFPDDQLYISIPGVEELHGLAALKKMQEPIVTKETGDAYKSGTYTPAPLFPSNSPAPPTAVTR